MDLYSIQREGSLSMTATHWFAVILVACGGFSAAAVAARAPSAPAAQPSATPPAGQVPGTPIAPLVNHEVTSPGAPRPRLRLVMLSSNLPDTPETRKHVAAQVLRTIVDEKLQLQEAKRQNVTATDAEINKAVAQIERQNNMQPGQLEQVLKQRGIDRGA